MSGIKFFKEKNLPLEMHKVRIVQKLNLLPIEERLQAIKEAGKYRIEGKDYVMKDGDVVFFRFNV